MTKKKIVYLEGRPNAHILHRRLAESLGCDIDYIDAKSRWQDLGKSSFSNVISWFKNARYLAKRYIDYEVFLIDNLHFTPVIMNLFFTRKKKKLVVHLGSHTLFFMYAKIFSNINVWAHKKILQQYDALVCEGNMAKQLAESLLNERLPLTYVTFLGPPAERLPVLNAITPNLESPNIIIIANGPTSFRQYYKGLDVMIKGFEKISVQLPELRLQILGVWSADIINQLLSDNIQIAQRISFEGSINNIEAYLSQASLCLHCARGDAFPTSTLEAMAAGVPTMVSEWTGTKEIVEQVDERMIVPMNELSIAERISWYYGIPRTQKEEISKKCKTIVNSYTEELAIQHYQKTFNKLFDDIGI